MSADIQRGHVSIELDRPRVLIFDNRATWELMRAYGPGFMGELWEKRAGEISIKSLEALERFLFIGLRRDAEDAGETLDAEQVSAFIRPLTIQPIFSALLVALTWTPEKQRKNARAADGENRPAATNAKSTGPRPNGSHLEGSD